MCIESLLFQYTKGVARNSFVLIGVVIELDILQEGIVIALYPLSTSNDFYRLMMMVLYVYSFSIVSMYQRCS